MSAKTEAMKIVVLYEDEIRIAAKAVKHFYDCVSDDTKATEEEKDTAFNAMCNACHVALHGAEADDVTLLMGKKP